MDEEELKMCKRGGKEWHCPVADCCSILTRKQTLQSHLMSCHKIRAGNPSKRYKMYEVQEDTPIPKSTYYHRKQMVNVEPNITLVEEEPYPTQTEEEPYTTQAEEEPYTTQAEEVSNPSDNVADHTNDSLVEDTEIEEEVINNFIDSFGPPLYIIPPSQHGYRAPIQQQHHYLTLCAFATYHGLSDRGFKHLINLMGLHIPTENLMEHNIDTLKEICGFEDGFLNYHLYCHECKKLFKGEDNCKTPGCHGTKQKNSQHYFVTGSMQVQLKEILERNGIWTSIQEYASNRPEEHLTISDILDGEGYRKLKTDGGFLTSKSNITVSLFTDGIPLFQSSKVSLWPVYLIINELPPKQRFTRKNMLLWGIWQGPGKPQMNMFLRPLVEDLVQLYNKGVEINIDSCAIVVKAMLIVATMDLQARAYVLQMTQHNGEYGCLYCLEPGTVVKSGKGNCRTYPFRDQQPAPRTKANIQADAQEACNTGKKVHGICSETVLSCLPNFDISTNVVIDYMHGILLGIMKKLMTLWFDSKHRLEPYFIGQHVDDIDKIIKMIQPPYFLRRLPRKIAGNYNHWKASEFRNWLLYFSLPALKQFLPDVYLTHYSLLVESTTILLGEGITAADLARADNLLNHFVKHIDILYSENILGLNVHNLLHLTKCVKMWGPLWAWSCFVFESFNGEIKRAVHGTGNACRQIFWSLQCQKKIEALAIQCADDQLRDFYKSMTEGSNIRQAGGEEAFQCEVVNPIKCSLVLPLHIQPQLVHHFGTCNPDDFKMVKKIARNGFLMYSKQCTRVVKRNSYTIKTTDGHVIEVEFYLMHKMTRKVVAVCQQYQPLGPLLQGRVRHLQTYAPLRNGLNGGHTLMRAENLQEPVVVVKTRTQVCCGSIPNNVERD